MKPLKLLMLAAANRGGGLLKTEPRKDYFNDVYRAVAPLVRKMIEGMANTQSLEQIKQFQEDLSSAIRTQTELHEISDRELLKMCEQIRVLWQDLGGNVGKKHRPKTHPILDEWWKRYQLSDGKRWLISYETRSFFPLEMNFRALIATVLFENRTHMKTCSNCLRYFFGPRHDSKYCMAAHCQQVYNNERQKRHQMNKSKKAN